MFTMAVQGRNTQKCFVFDNIAKALCRLHDLDKKSVKLSPRATLVYSMQTPKMVKTSLVVILVIKGKAFFGH